MALFLSIRLLMDVTRCLISSCFKDFSSDLSFFGRSVLPFYDLFFCRTVIGHIKLCLLFVLFRFSNQLSLSLFGCFIETSLVLFVIVLAIILISNNILLIVQHCVYLIYCSVMLPTIASVSKMLSRSIYILAKTTEIRLKL